jgi:hypothetical protein
MFRDDLGFVKPMSIAKPPGSHNGTVRPPDRFQHSNRFAPSGGPDSPNSLRWAEWVRTGISQVSFELFDDPDVPAIILL